MRKFLFITTTVLCLAAQAEDRQFTSVQELTQNYFIMAYDQDGTWMSPYWTSATYQNVQQDLSATVCGGSTNYYLFKASPVTYQGETCYRISISNQAHSTFSGIGGGYYWNSAGWVFFAGVSEATGHSHVYGQDFDAGGLWRITYTENKGYQFQCVGNDKFINGTMGHSSTVNKYYWQCFAEGSLYGEEEAMKRTLEYLTYEAMQQQLQALVDNTTDIVIDDATRSQLSNALIRASNLVTKELTIENLTTSNQRMRTAALRFIKKMTLLNHYAAEITCLLANPSFESGDLTGWTNGKPSGGDVGVKTNTGDYVTEGTDGNYLFNTWVGYDAYQSNTQDQYVEQTVNNLPKGEYLLTALSSSNSKADVELYGANQVLSFVPTARSSFGDAHSLTIYLTDTKLVFGMRSTGWFRADNFKLYYLGATDEYEQTRRLSVANLYEQIASQAVDRTSYDVVLDDVKDKLSEPDITDTEIDEQNVRLRTALMDLLRTGTTATGQFELTLLLPDNKTLQRTSTSSPLKIGENLKDMPAGHYTFLANALYRPTDTATALEQYEAGTDQHAAKIFVGDNVATVQNLFDDAPYSACSTSNVYSTIDGRGAPMDQSTATGSFLQGRYNCAVETDLETDGDLNFGFRIEANSQNDNWLVAGNKRLLYGPTPTATFEVSLSAGQLTPLCLPITLKATDVGKLYAVGSVTGTTAILYPVSSVMPWQPCVVCATEDITTFNVPATEVSTAQPDVIPLPWEGGTIKPNTSAFSWTTTTLDEKKTSTAETLNFVITDPMASDFTVNMENLQARRFLELEDYTTTTSSHIGNYNVVPPARRDLPNSVGLPVSPTENQNLTVIISERPDLSEAQTINCRLAANQLAYIPNLIPQRTYYYKVEADENIIGQGQVHTSGHLRMMYVPSVSNVRDLGGWPTTDGQRIRYGLVYRGGELNGNHVATQADLQRLRDLGIGAELDLRYDADNSGAGTSAFGFITGSTYYYANANDLYIENMTADDSRKRWKEEFQLLMSNLRAGRSVLFHCIWGADRTGLFSLLLEGILGLPQDQSNKNYELTSFSLAGARWRGTQDDFFNYIRSLKGANLQKKFNTFFRECLGISQTDINDFRQMMLSDGTIGIDEPSAPLQSADAKVYNLQGQRLSAPRRGFNIIGGRKAIIP